MAPDVVVLNVLFRGRVMTWQRTFVTAMLLLAVLPTLAAALAPQPRACRRATLQGAASAAWLTLLPGIATASDDRAGFGQGGALRSDIGESDRGSGVEVLITDLSYTELAACPPKFFIPPKGGPWSCIQVTASAFNQGKRDATVAEVFGQVYDAENYACLATSLDPSQKAPIAVLEGQIPKGEKTPVTFVLAVQARSPRPFRFAGMKASLRNAAMEKIFKPFDPCEIDSSACAEDEDQPSNADALREGRGYLYKR